MEVRALSQTELARRVGVTQGAIAKIVGRNPGGSAHIHKIARELGTSPAYLMGEIDDPDEGAPPPQPAPRHQVVTMSVLLPSEATLARMFLGLLRPFELDREDVLAQTLARQLPKGLRLLEGPLIEGPVDDPDLEAAEVPADDHRAPRRARRT